MFVFLPYVMHAYVLSFPTRRSSDLGGEVGSGEARSVLRRIETLRQLLHGRIDQGLRQRAAGKRIAQEMAGVGRSEEHTSELQSRQYLVCRLLLEKKKNQP